MPHVLIITLGPIQDFIASARKARDLWFGSWLLSELSRAAAKSVRKTCGRDALVFPGGDDLHNPDISVANKIVARVDGPDPGEAAKAAAKAVQDRLAELRDGAFSQIHDGQLAQKYFLIEKAKMQVSDLIEVSWVSAPEGAGSYAVALQNAERLLAARKQTRLWQPVGWGDAVPKSSLDGERESVLIDSLFDQVKPGGISSKRLRDLYGIGKSERLCGVGLLKRHGERPGSRYSHRFLSTGHIAAWPLLQRLEKQADDPALRKAWDQYIERLEALGVDLEALKIAQPGGWSHKLLRHFDGSLLFDNRLADLFEDEENLEAKKKAVRAAREALAPVLAQAGAGRPVPYYAILVGDGDHMGKLIRRQTESADHKKLSEELDRFARKARGIVEGTHAGELIYAGGDDVMAFVPLHRAVSCARALADEFKRRMEAVRKKDEPLPTLSVGIGISHFLEPMRGALDLARKAEKLAKETRGALAVILDKRSGPPLQVSGPWGKLDEELKEFTRMHRGDLVPDRAAYELQELEHLTMGVETKEDLDDFKAMARAEAERILRRKQPSRGAKAALAKEILEHLQGALKEYPPRELADRLIVARLLAQAEDQAGVDLVLPQEEKP